MKVNEAYNLYIQDVHSELNYERLGKALLKYVRAIMAREFGNRFYDLEDIAGDVAFTALSKLDQFSDSKENFAKWVYGVVYNACIDRLRKRSRRREQRLIGNESVEDRVSRLERVILNGLLRKLSNEEQMLIASLRAGYSLIEIAQENGESLSAVKMRWTRVLDKLRTLGGGG